ncbi:hypothetical protein Tco_1420530 [Tanacetum coccineum]
MRLRSHGFPVWQSHFFGVVCFFCIDFSVKFHQEIIMANPPLDHNEFALVVEAAPDNMNSWVEWDEDEEEEDPKEDPKMEE